ncbi:SDR family oxidoreductase [Spirillospora sp. NPDC048819]|uniref:SDR family NAD(P)-dependent oxidoreductase n=1 Tax=Spirillospora sp. NPDC048819 TaxID=3155268 RepID=UPI0033C3F264
MTAPGLGTRFGAEGTAVVTGAASGIGLATAMRLADGGYDVLALDRNSPQPSWEGDHSIDFRCVDVRDVPALQATVRDGLADRPPLRAVCSAAGVRRPMPLSRLTVDSWDEIFDVNVRGVLFLLQECLPHLADGASVVLVGSPSSVADTTDLAYAASKAAVGTLARTLALALTPHGVRVNVVSPAFTSTGMTREADDSRRADAARRNVAGRVNEPRDIANAIAWLCGPEAATVSGTVVDVGGVAGMPARAGIPIGDLICEGGSLK